MERHSREVSGSTAVETRELQRAFDGFRSAIGEENAIHAGPLGELQRKRALESVVVQIREVNCASRFAADDFDDARMGMAERIDGDSAEEIEIFFAGGIKDVAAAAVGQYERRAFVGREQEFVRSAYASVRVSARGWARTLLCARRARSVFALEGVGITPPTPRCARTRTARGEHECRECRRRCRRRNVPRRARPGAEHRARHRQRCGLRARRLRARALRLRASAPFRRKLPATAPSARFPRRRSRPELFRRRAPQLRR